jgi:hypothetical protein
MSVPCFDGIVSYGQDCELQWKNLLHPSWNRSAWTKVSLFYAASSPSLNLVDGQLHPISSLLNGLLPLCASLKGLSHERDLVFDDKVMYS